MAQQPIRFDDGAAYERMMGVWSQIAGEKFLDWLAPAKGAAWVDVGCGNGAFTELVVQRCAPTAVEGIDPSEGQLSFARMRPASRAAKFRQGDAMALPFADASFDIAVMALVIFFVPDPPKGVAEMARVVRPGGSVAAYAWDIEGGGFPWEPIMEELRRLGHKTMGPPRPEAAGLEAMQRMWTDAGFVDVETCEIKVKRDFASFDEFLSVGLLTPSVAPIVKAMTPADVDLLKARLREKLPSDSQGRITYGARANAVKGQRKK